MQYLVLVLKQDTCVVFSAWCLTYRNRFQDIIYRKVNSGYVLSGSDLTNITVTAQNQDVEISGTFSVDYDSVLICEKDLYTIGLKVDTDNNGTYETELPMKQSLNNLSGISSDSIKLGDSITVSANAVGGTAPYLYQVVYKQKAQSKWTSGNCIFGQ